MNAFRPLQPAFRFLIGFAVVVPQLNLGRADDVVRQRYPSGSLSEERHVALDAHGNYVNHGPLKRWRPDGELVLQGRYAHGAPDGTWTQWIEPSPGSPLGGRPANNSAPSELASGSGGKSIADFQAAGFQPPFLSRAEFRCGNLHGSWIICDALQRPCATIEFRDGNRHGDAIWHAPDGNIALRETYREGLLEGEVLRYSPESQDIVCEGPYVQGYLLSPRLVAERPETLRPADADSSPRLVRQAEGGYALGPAELEGIDDFWSSRLGCARLGDDCLPHGSWKNWRPNGQIQFQGAYYLGRPVGKFRWWRDNGLMACSGEFKAGHPSGTWTWWDAQGLQVSQRILSKSDGPSDNRAIADRPGAPPRR